MRLRQSREERVSNDLMSALAGAAVGFGIGFLLSRRPPGRRAEELRERVQGAVRRLRPARKERLVHEQEDLDRLEERVLNEFLLDEILSERAIDIGAVTTGIIELTGSVRTEEEAQRAVNLAGRVPGVETVVNRLNVEETGRVSTRRRLDEDELQGTFGPSAGRVGGMGRRRQSPETEPERPDDSQRMRESALAAADREQWSEEGYAPVSGRAGETGDLRPPPPTHFREDELDNQDPRGNGADRSLDASSQPDGAPVGDEELDAERL